MLNVYGWAENKDWQPTRTRSRYEILMQDLVMTGVVAKFVFCDQSRTSMMRKLLMTCFKPLPMKPDFLKVITGDVSWVYGYNPETKAQSPQWKSPGSPHLKKVWQSRSKTKPMLTVIFDWEGVAHHKYAPPGQTIKRIKSTTTLFFDSWEMQYDEKQTLWTTGDWQLHHNNAIAHATRLVQSY